MTAVALHRVEDGPADAPVTILLSSLGTTGAMWDPVAGALAAGLRVVRPDHRGHGASPVPPGPYALADLGADVLALLDDLGAERAHVVGISLGGMVGQWLAAHAPERVDRLVLCCTSAAAEPREAWSDRAATVEQDGVAAIADAVVERWLTPPYAREHPDTLQWLRAMLLSTPPAGYAACCRAIGSMDLLGSLGAIAAPTLVVAARQDPSLPPEHSERIAAAIPGSRYEVVDAAHLCCVERPDEVAALITAHLTG